MPSPESEPAPSPAARPRLRRRVAPGADGPAVTAAPSPAAEPAPGPAPEATEPPGADRDRPGPSRSPAATLPPTGHPGTPPDADRPRPQPNPADAAEPAPPAARRRVAMVALGVAVVVAAAGAGAAYVEADDGDGPSVDPAQAAIVQALPDGFVAVGTVDTDLRYEVTALDAVGDRYIVTVYRDFDPSTLDAAGLPRQAVGGDTADTADTVWTGFDEDTVRAVWLEDADGVVVRVSHQVGGNPVRPTIAELTTVAQTLVDDPAVTTEAAEAAEAG